MTANTHWTPEQDARLCELWARDVPVDEIAAELGRTEIAVPKRARGALGLPRREIDQYRNPSIAWPAIQRELRKVPSADSKYLALVTGYSRRQMLLLLRQHHDAKELHIAKWVRYSVAGQWAPQYALGAGEDAPRPVPLTRAERWKNTAKKLKDNPEHYLRRNQNARLRYATRTGKLVRRDPLTAALFGGA
ncbi:hypothetical protein [Pandoraea apista]|uniref:hypothetical protein n=1 Tax=Pandoraea apista TaxID=93218 RepID=UPI0006582E6D|nr:hypothetical protein [Pandoraea apista]ALS63610.1 hypothetical protein AT395_00120 [Pandoraea apista]CFB63137.1 hypothetical protein LMG16407_03212 [Pandoraea apista]